MPGSPQSTRRWHDEIDACLDRALAEYSYRLPGAPGKTSDNSLDPLIQKHLAEAGFEVDPRDRAVRLLEKGDSPWRSCVTEKVVETLGRRQIDIVVWQDGCVSALIEVEDSLGDLRHDRTKGRKDRYDVLSVDPRGDGTYYYSYKSIERMIYAARKHNLIAPLFLVVGCIRDNYTIRDLPLIEDRLEAFGVNVKYKEIE